MAVTFEEKITLVKQECCNCGIVFAMPQSTRSRRMNDHELFYCPNGHSQQYTGKSEAEKLRQELADREWKLSRANSDAEILRGCVQRQAETIKRDQVKISGMKQRASQGICPCCNRQFKILVRHMANKHPEFVEKNSTTDNRKPKTPKTKSV